MGTIASQITSLAIVYSAFYSGADQRKHQSSASLAVRGIHQGPVNSPQKWSVARKMFPFDDVIMVTKSIDQYVWNRNPPGNNLFNQRSFSWTFLSVVLSRWLCLLSIYRSPHSIRPRKITWHEITWTCNIKHVHFRSWGGLESGVVVTWPNIIWDCLNYYSGWGRT